MDIERGIESEVFSQESTGVRLIYGKEDIVHARKMRLSVLSETVGLTNGG